MAMTLEDTVSGMLSDDYRQRFVAEWRQTRIRTERLRKMLDRADAGMLDFVPKSPLRLLKKQLRTMDKLLLIYEKRAAEEGIIERSRY